MLLLDTVTLHFVPMVTEAKATQFLSLHLDQRKRRQAYWFCRVILDSIGECDTMQEAMMRQTGEVSIQVADCVPATNLQQGLMNHDD